MKHLQEHEADEGDGTKEEAVLSKEGTGTAWRLSWAWETGGVARGSVVWWWWSIGLGWNCGGGGIAACDGGGTGDGDESRRRWRWVVSGRSSVTIRESRIVRAARLSGGNTISWLGSSCGSSIGWLGSGRRRG